MVYQKKRIILSAGGTGGHLFPAQSVASDLLKNNEILFVAGGLLTNPYFDRDKFPFKEVTTPPFSFRKPFQALKQSFLIIKGIIESHSLLSRFRPDIVIGFGSFFSFPILVAAWLKRIPIVLHEQNAIAGKVNRLFSKIARFTGITFPSSTIYLKGKTIPVQFPLRKIAPIDEIDVWKYFGLSPGRLTLLVFGGSQGARKLNALFLEAVSFLKDGFQVLHFTGKNDAVENARFVYNSLGIPACVKEFEVRMDLAWQASDLAISRAGAATIAELVAMCKPAILIPFPFASENHQEKNGAYFAHEIGGGVMLIENQINGKILAATIAQMSVNELTERKKTIESHKTQLKLQTLAEVIYDQMEWRV